MATLTEEEKKKNLAKIMQTQAKTPAPGPYKTAQTELKPVVSAAPKTTTTTPTTSSGGSYVSAPSSSKLQAAKAGVGTYIAEKPATMKQGALGIFSNLVKANDMNYQSSQAILNRGLTGAAAEQANALANQQHQDYQNLMNSFANKQRQYNQEQIAAREEAAKKYGNNFTGAAKTVYDFGYNAPMLAENVALSAVNPALGAANMAVQSFGVGANNALEDGATIEQANAAGLGNVFVEGVPEYLFGGVAKIPGLVKVGTNVTGKIANPVLRGIARGAADMATEGVGEAVTEAISPLNQMATYKQGANYWDLTSPEQIAYAGMLGAFMTGGINAAVNTPNAIKSAGNYAQQQQQARAFEALHGQPLSVENIINNAKASQAASNTTNTQPTPANIQQATVNTNTAQASQDAPIRTQNDVQAQVPNVARTALENRDYSSVGNRKVQAVMAENPAMKSDIQNMANVMFYDMQTYGAKGERNYEYHRGNEPEFYDDENRSLVHQWSGQKRQQSDAVTSLLDNGMSYSDIEDGMNRLIQDNGAENTANAKRVELEVLKAMENGGFRSATGEFVRQDGTFDSQHAPELQSLEGLSEQQLTDLADSLTVGLSNAGESGNTIAMEEYSNQLQQIEEAIARRQGARQNTAQTTMNPVINQQNMNELYLAYNNTENSIPFEQLSQEEQDFLTAVKNRSGLNVVIVDQLDNANADGRYSRGTVTLKRESLKDPAKMRKLAFHEVFHSMRGTEEWNELVDWGIDYFCASENITREELYSWVSNFYMQYDPLRASMYDLRTKEGLENVKDEIGGRFTEILADDESVVQRLWAEKPTVMQRILQWIRSVRQALRRGKMSPAERIMEDSLRKAEKSFESGLEKVRQNGGYNGDAMYQSKKLGGYFPDNEVSTSDVSVFGIENLNSIAEVQKKVPEYLADKYLSSEKQRKPITNIDTGMDIEVWKSGIKESFGKTNYYKYLSTEEKLRKLAVMPKLANLIKYGEVRMPESESYHPDDKSRYAYLVAPVKINGEPYFVNMDIKRTPEVGDRFYIHSISVDKKEAAPSRTALSKNGSYRLTDGAASDVDTMITQPENGVNGNYSISADWMTTNKNAKRLAKNLPESEANLAKFMEGSQVVNADGSPKVVYSGHGNSNLFGSKFDIKKATAGGFYFTENPDIASNYANGKLGVKENWDDGSQYKLKDANGKYVDLNQVRPTREQIDMFDELLSDEDDGILGMSYAEFYDNVAKYDPDLKSLPRNKYLLSLPDIYKVYYNQGLTLHYNGQTSQFEDLLNSLGIEWDSYTQNRGGVFPVYLSIKNPVDTSQGIPDRLMAAFEKEAARDRKRYTWEELDDLHWTKDYPMSKWVDDIKRMQETGEETFWATQIPTKARKIMLEMGYDGIKDTGGKLGGEGHTVWIALNPEQVKSSTGNRGTYDATKKDMRYSVGEADWLDNGRKMRGFTDTAREANAVSEEAKQLITDELEATNYTTDNFTYEPISNKSTMANAQRVVELNGWQKAASDFNSKVTSGDRITAQDIAAAEQCIIAAQKAGDHQAAGKIIADVAIAGTELGQAVQAYSMMKKLTPEGQLLSFKRSIQRLQNQQAKKGGNEITVDPNFDAEFLQANSQKKREELTAKAYADIAQQMEGSWADKLNAFRYSCMLCNPATHLRNMISNGAMFGAGRISDVLSATMQDVFIRNGERTKSLRMLNPAKRRELANFVDSNWENEAKQALKTGGSRYSNKNGYIQQNERIFKQGPVGNILENTIGNGKYSVSNALETEDMIAKEINYKAALIDYLVANGFTKEDCMNNVTKPNGASLQKGKAYAEQQARKRTFTEDNRVSDAINNFENNLGDDVPGQIGKAALGGLIPFRRTPINIMIRGIEYSPAGIGMTLYKAAMSATKKSGYNSVQYNINDVLDSLGANAVGSAIMAAGFWMAANGLLNAGGDDDNKKETYDSYMGDQNFAIVLPDGSSLSIDWLSPIAMPLLAGAAYYNVKTNGADEMDSASISRTLETLGKVADPVFEMSMMQGLTSALKSYSQGTVDSAANIAVSMGTSYAGQFVPQVLSKTAQAVDDTRRSSYAPKDGNLPKPIAQFGNQMQNKIPGWSMSNQAAIDLWGNERKREFAGDGAGDFAARLVNGLFNPSTYSSNKRTKLDNDLEDLYQKTGDNSVFPTTSQSYSTYKGETYYMSPEQYTAFAQTKGKTSYRYAADFVQSAYYKKLSDGDKAAVLSDLYSLASYKAKKDFIKAKTGSFDTSSYKSYENALASGNPVKYYALRQQAQSAGISLNSDYEKIMKDCDKMKLSYKKYANINGKISNMSADKNAAGKSISGSKKAKVVAYLRTELQNGRITREQYNYIYKAQGYK